MQSLRDQLLKAGLVTKEQAQKAEGGGNRRRKRRGGRSRGKPAEGAATEAKQGEAKPVKKPGDQPVNRMVDLSIPGMLEIMQAIETHRLREDVTGEVPFYFTLRDQRVRKLFVTHEISRGLEAGRLAIVENGDPDKHIIVTADAVSPIRAASPEAVRFFNQH
ncbi:MAG: DUF2058 family protein [Myxococcota bacterium]